MEPVAPGDLVKIDIGGPQIDGIVFDVPSRTKVVVAAMDRARGPGFRTVSPKVLSERTEEGPDDPALRLLMQRTPLPDHSAARGGPGGVSWARGPHPWCGAPAHGPLTGRQ